MRMLYLLLILVFCVSCQGAPNQNTFEHTAFGLSVTKPVSWEFLNQDEARARISGTKLEEQDIEIAVQALMSTPIVEISKDCNQIPIPKFSITANSLRGEKSGSPIDIIKRVSKNAPSAFKGYKIVTPPSEIQIANHKAAYMKVHYTGQFREDDKEYSVAYETWIVPRKKYFFMIGVVSTQNNDQNVRDEIDSIIKSLKITEQQSIPKNYLYEIMKSHFDEAEKHQYTINDYLEITKPYGIWDIRPRGISELDLEGELAKVGDVSWYHFGQFNAYLKMPKETVFQPVNKWMENIANTNAALKKKGSKNKFELNSLAEKVKKSGHNIFISHKKFQRVDDIYYQGEKYWKYDIPKDSYFKISERKIYLSDTSFSDKDKEILGLLKKQEFYGVINQNNTIIIMIDGFLNHSYGYILTSSEWEVMILGPLFNIQDLEKVHNAPDIYFYFSR